MIVVDVNTIAYLWLPGEMSELAQKVLMHDPHWVAPVLWRSEFRNILAGYLRRGDLDEDQVSLCLEGAESQMKGHEFFVPSALVMKKAAISVCSAYDCEYVALAEDLNVMLITADKKIIREFSSITVGLKVYADNG